MHIRPDGILCLSCIARTLSCLPLPVIACQAVAVRVTLADCCGCTHHELLVVHAAVWPSFHVCFVAESNQRTVCVKPQVPAAQPHSPAVACCCAPVRACVAIAVRSKQTPQCRMLNIALGQGFSGLCRSLAFGRSCACRLCRSSVGWLGLL